ncbi:MULTISPECIES: hypothetical protein [Nonlabens]|uniref:Uncharacterized protein n=2 Tax=Nonlabens ulvanivorans TaxID=906888 RepID=A0A090WKA2_NONUL|nr:hypothetical protein [Nonlabens ulvanivorans]PRX14208.1 hypothetical protein LY02_01238 [Nonlabens ulvanivorans]WOI23243.1 hypothetical protein R1T42_02095 [Nonlabens ulvanivorans]GAK99545.1 hypothetical protein JCM19314_3590 [Nonlabens ulvanivorans]GAL76633.1 hypothetical protein JCM19275_1781 [Nonlabens ulvanivorans]
MSRSFQIASIIIISLTIVWFMIMGMDKYTPQWQFLTAGGIHFLMSIIINRQFVKARYNYLGIIHSILMITLGGYGYFFV